jgi:DNA-binding NarL/FixJ family response regulator
MTKILIVEDQQIVLDGLAAMIAADKDFEIVGKLTNASHVLDFLKNNEVDLVLSDIYTESGANFLDYVAPVKKEYPFMKIIVMTGLPEISFVERAKKGGADAFIYKNIPSSELLLVIRNTCGGYNTFPTEDKTEQAFGHLSKQEIAVMRLLCDGHDRAAVAKIMGLSENTVKNYTANILAKTCFTSISQLAIFAVAHGFIVPVSDGKS